MALTLNTVRKSKGAKQNKKRVGRGNASGHGTYSTRGQKGQRSRSGVSGLKRLGMKKQLLQIPKARGFKSLNAKNQVVKVLDINTNYKDGEIVNPETLLAKKMIRSVSLPIKILGKESLTVKNLKFEKVKMSATLKEQVK
jgi:large subunit ribosomal protein L15